MLDVSAQSPVKPKPNAPQSPKRPETFETPEALAARIAGLDGPVAIEGAGTKAGIGFPVEAPRLSTRGLSGITYFEPKEFVLGALSGTPLSVLEAELARHDLILPFDPPRFDGDPSLGGVVATNLGGAERESLGAPRDNVLGVQYINGKGELLKAGGRVVKNVSGYDIPRGLCGSWGTLAALTEITIKVVPKARAVDQAADGLERVWAQDFVWRVSLPRDRSQAVLTTWQQEQAAEASQSEAEAAQAVHALQWDGALLWLGCDADRSDVHRLAAGVGGHALLVKSPPDHRAVKGCFQPLDAGNLTLHRLVKRAFDPEGRLNPGRLYEGL